MAEPIKVKTDTKILDYQGKPMLRALEPGTDPHELTFRSCVQFAMQTPLRSDETVDYKTKWLWHKLGQRCEKDEASFNAKATEIILERCAKLYGALIFGRIKELIDPEADDE